MDCAEELQAWGKFQLRSVCLHDGTDDGDVDILGGHIVCERDGGDVYVCRRYRSEPHLVSTTTIHHSYGRLAFAGLRFGKNPRLQYWGLDALRCRSP